MAENYADSPNVEVEAETAENAVLMENPFNPAKIDITTKPLTIDLLIGKGMVHQPLSGVGNHR
ncbi:MAG: hypothetical protein LBQ57_01250 [Spirochaetales bacterium]|jgi:hypothetical protein|nr:hypothetical protein [Spirochaetales bacterium]